ncbi:methyl-accepting chemotaxis protein [Pseudodesulfovibrio sediminis]|uniref:Methyl-accepting transducer domain-containing protein n=1 Tax=Pseudodesulfovibrio sediminis TaxID=2810563 RepID=A0ABM7P4K1_9BACT|nr:methyl-accepting chemotaxis protein [Pseudodesulfovibrio sediminis]BCS87807.1 hypothetical protein PSDVSF_10490 [Pseudodesulfovibrio sediminis]
MSQRTLKTPTLILNYFFGALTLITGAICVLAFILGMDHWLISTACLGTLLACSLLGFGMIFRLNRSFVHPIRAVSSYTEHLLKEEYAKANADLLKTTAPGLGDAIGELGARYKKSHGFSQSILNGLPIPCCIVDTDEKVTFLNRECLEMIGSNEDPQSYYGKNLSQIFYKDNRKALIRTCMESNERIMNREAIFKHENGSDINVLANLFPLSDVDGVIIGGCCLYLDTTQLKQHENEILVQNERIALAAQKATDISKEMATAAVQLSAVVSTAKTGTREQSERSSEIATAMQEMTATVLEVAHHARDAAEDANNARGRAEEGASIVTGVITSIHDVAGHAHKLKESMEELDDRAENIGKVLSVIEDIADQTNLLALNAAIEAARAGEAGRGFAVVADEVRKLAEKTMQATSEVHTAILGIQEGARQNVKATEIAVSSVGESTEMATHSGEALNAIVSVAESTAERVHAIATAAEQQSSASEQINAATMDVSRVCGETDRLMRDAAEAIGNLAQLADSLSMVIQNME